MAKNTKNVVKNENGKLTLGNLENPSVKPMTECFESEIKKNKKQGG